MIINNFDKKSSSIKNEFDNYTKKIEYNSNKLGRNFNYAISHEIKAPIRAIDSYARIFMEDYGNQVDQEGTELIRNIRDICKDSLTLINKLLDYIKYLNIDPVEEIINMKDIIEKAFDELVLGYSNSKKVQLKFENDFPIILGDSILIKQVIINLISNSLKFTVNKEKAIITAGYIFENNENIFYIKDNGAGFDMKFSENLFGIFQRMHSQDDFEGSGVGLAIVKEIIKKFNGRVWITGELGEGACAYFTIEHKNILK